MNRELTPRSETNLAKDLEDEFRTKHSPDNLEIYYKASLERVQAGFPSWVVRNFDSDLGRVYDFFVNQVKVCFIEEDYETGCNLYLDSELSSQPTLIGQPEISLGEALILATGLA